MTQHIYDLRAAVASLEPAKISAVIAQIPPVTTKKLIQANRDIIYTALANPYALKVIMDLFKPEEFEVMLKDNTDAKGNFVDLLDKALGQNVKSFCMLAKLYADDARAQMFFTKDQYNCTILQQFCDDPENFKLLFELVPEKFRLSVLKIGSQEFCGVYQVTQNADVKNFITQLFPRPWQTEAKVNAILNEATDLYLLAGTLGLYSESMKVKFVGIHAQLSLYYSSSLHYQFTKDYINMFEANITTQIKSEYRGIYKPFSYCAGFFTSFLSVENTDNSSDRGNELNPGF